MTSRPAAKLTQRDEFYARLRAPRRAINARPSPHELRTRRKRDSPRAPRRLVNVRGPCVSYARAVSAPRFRTRRALAVRFAFARKLRALRRSRARGCNFEQCPCARRSLQIFSVNFNKHKSTRKAHNIPFFV